MATRTPTSILILIDKRNRLAGELKKLGALKREASDLHDHVQQELTALSEALDGLAGRFDQTRIKTSHSLRSSSHSDYGLMTRLIIKALKDAGGRPLVSSDIAGWAADHWSGDKATIADPVRWRRLVLKRLRRLRDAGVVASPFVGNGHTSSTLWVINPDMLISDPGSESTLPHDDDLGNSHRTTGKDHTGGSA